MALNEGSVTIDAKGGSATLIVTFENHTGNSPPRVNASTANWADITIFGEPRVAGDSNVARFTVSSSSGKPGSYALVISSSCGKQDVTVTVR